MEPLQRVAKITYVTGRDKKLTVSVKGVTTLDIFSKFYKTVGYDPLLIMQPLVSLTSGGFVANKEAQLSELEEWLYKLMGSEDATLRTTVLSILKRIRKSRDTVGTELMRIMCSTPVKTAKKVKQISVSSEEDENTEEDDESYEDVMSSLKDLKLKGNGNNHEEDIEEDIEYNVYSPNDFPMFEPSPPKRAALSPSPSVTPPPKRAALSRSPSVFASPPQSPDLRTSSKRIRQSTPPGKSLSAKRRKAEKKPLSSWVMNKNVTHDISEFDPELSYADILAAIAIEEGYDGIEFWQFILHPAILVGEDTIELTNMFTPDEFWEWLDAVKETTHNIGIDFDFEAVEELKNTDLSGGELIDAVINAGYITED